jgi:hypothetical protein
MIHINVRTLLMAAVVFAAVLWLAMANMPQVPQQPRVVVVKPNQTQTPQPAGGGGTAGVGYIFTCPGDAYKYRNVIVCNPLQVLDSYILVQRGWIWAPNGTVIRLQGDISSCTLRLGVNTLYLDCQQPIMLVKT